MFSEHFNLVIDSYTQSQAPLEVFSLQLIRLPASLILILALLVSARVYTSKALSLVA